MVLRVTYNRSALAMDWLTETLPRKPETTQKVCKAAEASIKPNWILLQQPLM
jgi:hypothetical protein